MSLVDTIRSTLVPIHREGWKFVAGFFVASLLLGAAWTPLMWIGFILTAWCAYFFRDPERMTPQDDDLVCAAARRVLPSVPERTRRSGHARLCRAPRRLVRCMPGPLDTGAYRSAILQRYAEKHGVQSPFVFWGTLTEELLALALDCIPATHLRTLFARLLLDVKANRTGFPDLVRFWPAQRRYEFVEVKGPGDKLQDNQIRWLQYCGGHGIAASVCHVRWRAEPAGSAR